jgi:iron complex outermembrane receptor protein
MRLIFTTIFAVICLISGYAFAGSEGKFQLEEVVVTAPVMEEPLVVETDAKAPRQPVPAHDGADYLKTIPGFSVIRKGGTDGDPVFRGMAGSRLNILMDGQYILGGCGMRMDPPTAYVFPELYDKIKIFKGPQSVQYGGGNVGGVVLFEREPKYFETPAVHAYTGLMFGSFGRNDQIADVSAGMPLGFINAIGSRSDSGDYKDGAGGKVHSAYTRWSLSTAAGWTPDKKTSLILSLDRSDGEAAYADRTMDGSKFDRTGVGLKFEKKAVSDVIGKIKAQVYYNYVDHIMDNYSLRTKTAAMYMVNNPDRRTVGGSLSADLIVSDKVVTSIGLDYQQNKHTLRTRSQMMPIDIELYPRVADMTFTNIGVFGELTYSATQKDRIIGGVRGDFLDVKNEKTTGSGANSSITDNMFGGFVRYEHDLASTPVTLYAGIGHAQRPADWWERSTYNNFYLSPEKDTQLDMGVIYSGKSVRASVSAFYANINDFILVRNNSTARNIDAETFGGEADVNYLFAKNWRAGATLAYTYGKNKTDNAPLAQIPPFESRLTLNYDDKVFSAGALLRLVAAQDRFQAGYGSIVGQDIGRTAGFGVVSINAGYKPVKGLLIAAGIDNLFDKAYAEHISRAGAAVSGYMQTTRVNEPGRTFWVKANYRF